MKRLSIGICVILTAAIVLFSGLFAFVFAADNADAKPISGSVPSGKALNILMDEISPQDGSDNLQLQTIGIKLYFDGDVAAENVRKNNSEAFTFANAKGKEIPSSVHFDTKGNTGYLLVTVMPKNKNHTLSQNAKYSLTISGDLSSADGRVLGEDITLNYKTMDMSSTSKVYMLFMALMVAGMIGMTVFQNKRKAKAQAEINEKAGKVNPYKLAKEKKISVAEANAMIEKEKERRAKRLQKAGIDVDSDEEPPPLPAKEVKKVSRARPISEAGSTFKPERRAPKARKRPPKVDKNVRATAEQKAKQRAASQQGSRKKGKGNKGKKR